MRRCSGPCSPAGPVPRLDGRRPAAPAARAAARLLRRAARAGGARRLRPRAGRAASGRRHRDGRRARRTPRGIVEAYVEHRAARGRARGTRAISIAAATDYTPIVRSAPRERPGDSGGEVSARPRRRSARSCDARSTRCSTDCDALVLPTLPIVAPPLGADRHRRSIPRWATGRRSARRCSSTRSRST